MNFYHIHTLEKNTEHTVFKANPAASNIVLKHRSSFTFNVTERKSPTTIHVGKLYITKAEYE